MQTHQSYEENYSFGQRVIHTHLSHVDAQADKYGNAVYMKTTRSIQEHRSSRAKSLLLRSLSVGKQWIKGIMWLGE